jgi:hypothetical protein
LADWSNLRYFIGVYEIGSIRFVIVILDVSFTAEDETAFSFFILLKDLLFALWRLMNGCHLA